MGEKHGSVPVHLSCLSRLSFVFFSSDLMDFPNPYDMDEENREVVERPSEHEQEDGTIFATCVTGTSSKDSLITWIRYLQKKNPMLEHAKIVFTLKSPGIGGDDVSTPLIEQEKKLIEDGKEQKKQQL